MARKQSFSDKFWQDKHGHFVVWQKPNPFLWTWFIATVANVILPVGPLQRGIGVIGGVAILIWAVLELYSGVDYFRRTLGFCVLLLFAASYIF